MDSKGYVPDATMYHSNVKCSNPQYKTIVKALSHAFREMAMCSRVRMLVSNHSDKTSH